ncbi:LysR family transcriptional regulator [Metapseudomonas furukawaii]|jgi:DNA-binding transcriptional LysR family regulator|uniref:Transcriptional regulator n=1 Tax=Metapseudomonas furukawaii TaxID=1149133 RepID=A0AAD1FFV3_METFU|nr:MULTISPECIES: LysR family transcriptional regulator [Pseudomonas]ELS25082.1 transcriptional regulator, LysR family [Pseudomonas furukawaii]OWJ91654.1 nodulation protein NfeD [Pseudomonas sp. A46]WAG76895.1 LysR family transcriptional regulator [Pseudomonas furukawaii]BAU74861.1 transcriptional regulator [Pseudomonas furukawaii]
MRFKHLDLNLLVALDVLLEEQNITRAAARLHMTQSATSGVLGRLRNYFEDDLLVQVGRKMMPTPLAKDLEIPVREVLLKIQTSITAKPVYDIAESKRHFRIMASDYLISVLFAEAIREINHEAPLVTFELISPGQTATEMLMRGEVDLMIAPEHFIVKEHPSQLLFDEQHVCVVWEQNMRVGDRLTLEQYLDLGHVAVAFGRSRTLGIEEWFMTQYGCKRRLEVITHDFNTLPQLVVGTERVATMHSRLARLYARNLPLRILPPPVELPTMQEFMSWHRSLDRDPMLRWLREKLVEIVNSPESPITD